MPLSLVSRSQTHPLHDPIIEALPALRAFARSLTRDATEADDLVQETLTKAIAKIPLFQRGTNLKAWLFTIMRNTFYTRRKKADRERPGASDCVSALRWSAAAQDWSADLRAVLAAILGLPRERREALVLVGMLGFDYAEAARICDCPVGTIKSRLNRARAQLRALLEEQPRQRADSSCEAGEAKKGAKRAAVVLRLRPRDKR